MSRPLSIFIHPMDGSGHVAACTGIAQSLANRGHSITFLTNAAYAGQFTRHVFKEVLLHQTASKQANSQSKQENPVKAIAAIIKKHLLNDKSPLQKIRDHQLPEEDSFMIELTEKMEQFDGQIAAAIAAGQPDLILLDHFLIPPAIARAGIPWVFLFSGNPLPMYRSELLPPYGSGYPTSSSPSTWTEFQALVKRIYVDRYKLYQLKLYQKFGYSPGDWELAQIEGDCFPKSPYLNIYGYPEELDYDDLLPMPERFIRVDNFCRQSAEPFALPDDFQKSSKAKIYFSLGSMGAADVELMQRVTSILGKTDYHIIVSKGPLAEEFGLPENSWGQAFLPQTAILPLCDLVITHGGNNTVTETFSFGKPMLLLPLFADQYDNAQRIHEKGYGIRLDTYHFEEKQFLDAVQKLMKDKELKLRLDAAAKRIAESKSKEKACIRIEQLAKA